MHTAVWHRERETGAGPFSIQPSTQLKPTGLQRPAQMTKTGMAVCEDHFLPLWLVWEELRWVCRVQARCRQGNLEPGVCTHRWSGVSLVPLFTLRSLTLNRCLMLKAICRLTLVPSRKAERFVAGAQLSSPSRVPVWRGSWNLWCLSATHGRSAKVWRR